VTEQQAGSDRPVPELIGRLAGRLEQEERLITAFSGGADSALLAAMAHQVLGSRALAVTAVSASLPGRERADPRHVADPPHVAGHADAAGRTG
jgi:uncharacterized protein